MKNNLDSRKWKEFSIKEIFNTQKSARGFQTPTGANITNKNLTSGKEPRITVTSLNNGVLGFCSSNDNNYRTFENFISVSFLGSTFYHPYKASLDMKVHCLKVSNYELSINSSSFLITSIKKNIENASYGNQISSTDLTHKRILLPIKDNKKPDYQFMEDYSKNLLETKKEKYLNYNKKKLADLKYKEIEPLENKEWKEFFVKDIFTLIQRGKRLIKNAQIKGDMPYISSTASKNGIDNFLSNKESVRIFSNCITIANSGSVGASFFHPYSFVASDHVTHLNNEEFSKYIYLFIATIANRYSEKYNFNREINDVRLSREKIMLPITTKGRPDYQYMEQHIKNIEYKKRIKYQKYSFDSIN